ncbi:MAG: TlyA family RNA methyltransferase [Nitrospirota bacterium]|nr:TlyA family RNA methyltransferase [Nitrospirota bacterium]
MKERLDKILVDRGLVKSREIAKALIMEGKVFVDGQKITKAGTSVNPASDIMLKETDIPYVSRGGLKLEAAIQFFHINVSNKVIIDVGSSTGGFTDCMLKNGAKKVYCIDVGYGQLAWPLRKDPRVVLIERTNIRYLDTIIWGKDSKISGQEFEELIKCTIDMATVDVSFISLTKVMPVVLKFLKNEGEVLALVKPQFEVGKGEVGKGGIVREEEKRLNAVEDVRKNLERLGLKTMGIFQSPISGQKGNREYFLYMKKESYGRA